MTGLIRCPIDLPSFSWSVSVSDSAMATTRDKNAGEQDATGLRLPWGAVPARSAAARADLLCPDKRSIMLCWKTADDPSEIGTPIVGGSITPRTDTASDTSFTLASPLSLLADRYLIDERRFGTAAKGTTSSVISYRGLSRRGLAAEFGARVTGGKAGGILPIDWNYLGERGTENRDYHGYDIQNLDFKSFLTRLTNLENGPDCQFRPKLSDGSHFRWDFLAASDADVYLEQSSVVEFHYSPLGGTIEDLSIDHAGPTHRVYMTGAGAGDKMKCAMSENLTLVQQTDPWPLREAVESDNDIDDTSLLQRAAAGRLAGLDAPIMQIKGSVYFTDRDQAGHLLHPPGSFHTGERVHLWANGFPTLADGMYITRLMQMDGDESGKAQLTFDVMADPML
nr:hypothetical protein [Bifidobacterium ramosum]